LGPSTPLQTAKNSTPNHGVHQADTLGHIEGKTKQNESSRDLKKTLKKHQNKGFKTGDRVDGAMSGAELFGLLDIGKSLSQGRSRSRRLPKTI